jgi:hypothetical protein
MLAICKLNRRASTKTAHEATVIWSAHATKNTHKYQVAYQYGKQGIHLPFDNMEDL